MDRRVRLRSDGLLEIRRASRRRKLTIRNQGLLAVLLVACVMCTSLVVAGIVDALLMLRGLLASTLLSGAGAVAFVLALRAAGMARCHPRAGTAGDGTIVRAPGAAR